MDLKELKVTLQESIALLSPHVLESTDVAQSLIKLSACLSTVSRLVRTEKREMQAVIDMNKSEYNF